MKTFTKQDIGCYADEALGQDNRRERLASLMAHFDRLELAKELRGTAPGDFADETDAIGVLQENTQDGLVWVQDGDLLLMSESELEG